MHLQGFDPDLVKRYFDSNLGRVIWRGYQGSARCPFHDDTRPSFSANAELGVYLCHACGAKGNLVTFEAHRTGCDTRTAWRNLAYLRGRP